MKLMYQDEEVTVGSGGAGAEMREVTLAAGDWGEDGTQSVSAPGVLADETRQLIQLAPASGSRASYEAAGITCTGQAADRLTFRAETVPSVDLTVYAAVMDIRKKQEA